MKRQGPLYRVTVHRPDGTVKHTNIAALGIGHLRGDLVLVPTEAYDHPATAGAIEVGSDWTRITIARQRRMTT